ncbi:hypothetical protein [Streptomyces sp. 11x1]|uniref:hypothetical protein n=1 Tax=Streptomyces sp. 11x1 TaxID=3038642 RepID=UPI00293189CC|nr:hypothetical protein [Streptomyces sp. 11x1]WNZ10067.1 hypothetical protein P8T65_22350 [Streptomyces sp. 11x1]
MKHPRNDTGTSQRWAPGERRPLAVPAPAESADDAGASKLPAKLTAKRTWTASIIHG